MSSLLLSATLPFALLAGSAAATSDNAPIEGAARSQASATARIVRGESIRFGRFNQRLAPSAEVERGVPYALPLARSQGRREVPQQPVLIFVEFH